MAATRRHNVPEDVVGKVLRRAEVAKVSAAFTPDVLTAAAVL